MAKKRRLSKRDREIKARMWAQEKWDLLLKDDDFTGRLFGSIQDVGQTFSGFLVTEWKTLRYYIFNGKKVVNGYDVAVLTDEGVFIYSRPYSDSEDPF